MPGSASSTRTCWCRRGPGDTIRRTRPSSSSRPGHCFRCASIRLQFRTPGGDNLCSAYTHTLMAMPSGPDNVQMLNWPHCYCCCWTVLTCSCLSFFASQLGPQSVCSRSSKVPVWSGSGGDKFMADSVTSLCVFVCAIRCGQVTIPETRYRPQTYGETLVTRSTRKLLQMLL